MGCSSQSTGSTSNIHSKTALVLPEGSQHPIPLPSPPFKRNPPSKCLNVSRILFHLGFFHIFCSPVFFTQNGKIFGWKLADLGYGSSQCWRDAGWDELGSKLKTSSCDGWGVVGRGLVSSLDLFFPFFGEFFVARFFAKHKERCTLVTWCIGVLLLQHDNVWLRCSYKLFHQHI